MSSKKNEFFNRYKYIFLLLLIVTFVSVIAVRLYYHPSTEMEQTRKEVLLYFSTKDAMYLKGEPRIIDSDNIFVNTIKELIAGPNSSSLSPTIPQGVELISITINNGVARLNFNRSLIENHWGGSSGESLTVYSIVNTMTQFPEIKSVQFLIEGEEVETLAGHIYLKEPIQRNDNIIE